ncbi:hypothetical protein ACVILL_004535 [Bradyrhizobium sp. USDA 3364]
MELDRTETNDLAASSNIGFRVVRFETMQGPA